MGKRIFTEPISCFLPKQTYQKIKEMAEKKGINLSKVVRSVITKYFEDLRLEEGQKLLDGHAKERMDLKRDIEELIKNFYRASKSQEAKEERR